MKYIFCLIMLIIFSLGCGPSDFRKLVGIRKFAVGDCLHTGARDEWDNTANYIVLALGDRSYKTAFIYQGRITIDNIMLLTYGYLWEDFYKKVDCPKGLK